MNSSIGSQKRQFKGSLSCHPDHLACLHCLFRARKIKICENAVISRGWGIVVRLCSLAAAATRGVGDAVARADLNTRLGVGSGLRAHALLDLAGHGEESLLDITRVLGRCLEEGDAQAVGEFLCSIKSALSAH